MITFRKAELSDVSAIAKLHAKNWQENYRGVFSDTYLDTEVVSDRLVVWNKRLTKPANSQHVILAEEGEELLGFSCAYFNEDNTYGTYLDNLHVSSKAKGKGVGTKLMLRLSQDILRRDYNGLYLWVIDNNISAIRFYNNIDGKALDKEKANDIGDITFTKMRYAWSNVSKLELYLKQKLKMHER
jgi:ribosomal protein S18 acetylase RimI-like enzyme